MTSFGRKTLQYSASVTSVIQRLSDILTISFGLYFTRLFFHEAFMYQDIIMVLASIIVFQMIGGFTDFYRSWRGVRIGFELRVVLQSWVLSVLVTFGALSLVQIVNENIVICATWFLIVCLGLIISRLVIRYVIGHLRNKGYNTRNVAIMGAFTPGIKLAESLRDAHWMGFRVLGIYDDGDVPQDTDIPKIGDFKQLIHDARVGKIDRVYIALPMTQEKIIKEAVEELSDSTCSVVLIPDVFTFNLLHARTDEINGVPVVSLFDTPMIGVNRLIKRLEDIIVSIIILTFISPILLFIAIAVKLTSPGPVIFKQQRYGIDGKGIAVWKFRSMVVMENGDSVVQATKGDARITKLGSFLRKTSLDELPQFINVLKGDMSIVGPRPHAVAHNELYRTMISGYMLRHKMKPGITGWAQINGWRGETDTLDKMEKRVEFDLDYIHNWSLGLDLKIIFLTIFKGFIHKAAY
ncbi:undecaprenyl-phosphate glucose phosphotransferase [Rouxiella chamberiensis]|uniref:Undecaprenyl-phosphate glucose phosphotransferase n=1 Tax=Rouxiella chamberiensis TaxID=1513468 RepID=A0ABY7HNR1_9GAMM|nr:undecaprenyl-phosphate glucose phosphotransferase [Rouxiella chamberiensis]WAT01004.1 undecaprenyl-phosphate glucose phosphotransferase [Rouxiella chamberiensis]